MATNQATFDQIAAKARESDESDESDTITREPQGEPAAGFPRRVEDSRQLSEGMLVSLDRLSGARYEVARANGNIITLSRDNSRFKVYGGGPGFTRRNSTRESELYLVGLSDSYTPPESYRQPLLSGEPDRSPTETGKRLD